MAEDTALISDEEDEPLQVMGNATFQIVRDIPYITPSDGLHKLDLYIPAGDPVLEEGEVASSNMRHSRNSRLPVVIHVHGGGWKRGDKSQRFYGAPQMCRGYSRYGFIAVAPNYRLKTRHPEHAEDVAAAIAWVRCNIAHYGGDPECIFLSGHSAGGHLVSLVTLDPSYLAKYFDEPVPQLIRGVVSISGVYSLHNAISESEECTIKMWLYRKMYIDGTFGTDKALLDSASPAYHVQNSAADELRPPPFLLMNASIDLGLEYDGKRLYEAFCSKGWSCTYWVNKGTTHGTITRSSTTVAKAVEFIRDVLSKTK